MSFSLSENVRAISSFINALSTLEAEICGRRTTLPNAASIIAKNGQSPAKEFFTELSQGEQGKFGENYRALLNDGSIWRLNTADCEELSRLGNVLGRYSTDIQKTAIDECISHLEASHNEALRKRDTNGRIFRAAGVSFGIMLACIAL